MVLSIFFFERSEEQLTPERAESVRSLSSIDGCDRAANPLGTVSQPCSPLPSLHQPFFPLIVSRTKTKSSFVMPNPIEISAFDGWLLEYKCLVGSLTTRISDALFTKHQRYDVYSRNLKRGQRSKASLSDRYLTLKQGTGFGLCICGHLSLSRPALKLAIVLDICSCIICHLTTCNSCS